MVEITVDIPLYENLSLGNLVVTLLVLSIPRLLEFFLLNFKKHYEIVNPKKIQNVIIANTPGFRKLSRDINKIKRNTLYYQGREPTGKDTLLDLIIFFAFSIIAIYGLLPLETHIIDNQLKQYLAQNDNVTLVEYLMLILNDVIAFFSVISIAGIMLIFYRRDVVAPIFSTRPYLGSSSHIFPATRIEHQFKKLRICSYVLLFINIAGAVQLLAILSVGDALTRIILDEHGEVLPDFIGNLIVLGVIGLLWILSFVTVDRMISYRIKVNRLITLLESKKLPHAQLNLSNGKSVDGLIFNPFTDKTYLVMVDPKDITTKVFVPWKRIEWIKLKTKA